MKNKNKIIGLVSIAFVLSMLVVAIPQVKANPQFVLAYDYILPDGNGVSQISVLIDGVQNGTMYYASDPYPTYTADNPKDIDVGVNLTLIVRSWVNATFCDIATYAEGYNIIRHSIVVTCTNGTTVFSQQNFTYWSGTDYYDPMFHYEYWVYLDFVPTYGEVYTATVVYELYY